MAGCTHLSGSCRTSALAQAQAAERGTEEWRNRARCSAFPMRPRICSTSKACPLRLARICWRTTSPRRTDGGPQTRRRGNGAARQDPHGAVRLWRRRNQSRSRHAAQSLAYGPARARRLLQRQRRGGRVRPGAVGARHGHGRISPGARGAVRDRGTENNRGTDQPRRGLPAVAGRSTASVRSRVRSKMRRSFIRRCREPDARDESTAGMPRTIHCVDSRKA